MDRSTRAPGQGDLSEWKELIAVTAVGGFVEAAALSMRIGEVFGGPDQDVPWHPVELVAGLATEELVWSSASTGGAVTLVVGAALGAAGTRWAWKAGCAKCAQLGGRLRGRSRERVDSQARYLAKGKEVRGLTYKSMLAKAAELRVRLRPGQAPGVSIGVPVLGNGGMLYASYEDLHLDIMGPRAGKTSARVIPAVMEAVGPVVATSNKRDVVDATRLHRERTIGGRAWVFDPQAVAEEPPLWYWDPIAWVAGTDGGAGAQQRAAELAGHFAAGGDADKRDAFFDPEGEDLLAALFLAAAVAKRPVTEVYRWVTKPKVEEPIEILAEHGDYEMIAAGLHDQYAAPDRQRAGVFSTAKKMAACLKLGSITRWVTPPVPGEAARDSFDTAAFATSRDTLYPLSREGKGTAGPLVTAMTAAVVAAGAEEGGRHGGRLPVPMLVVLDEAANIVKWADLPKQYSHFGSRGIVVMTILQSWAQGARCWGSEGMTALWSASNVRVLGAGLADAGFLRDIETLVGDHYEQTTSISRSRDGGVSRSLSLKTEKTLTASDLAALPQGRVLAFVSKHRPMLLATVPWWERPYAGAVAASLDRYDPARRRTAAVTAPTITDGGRHLRVVPPRTQQEGDPA